MLPNNTYMRALRKYGWAKAANRWLDDIANYPDDWDGQGAKKINRAVITEARQRIELSPDTKVPKRVRATPDGCIVIQWFDGTETEIPE